MTDLEDLEARYNAALEKVHGSPTARDWEEYKRLQVAFAKARSKARWAAVARGERPAGLSIIATNGAEG